MNLFPLRRAVVSVGTRQWFASLCLRSGLTLELCVQLVHFRLLSLSLLVCSDPGLYPAAWGLRSWWVCDSSGQHSKSSGLSKTKKTKITGAFGGETKGPLRLFT